MTIDKAKLKALAEAQPVKEWARGNGRLPDNGGPIRMYYVEGPEGVSDYEDWGFTRAAASFIAAANPATVLELIAELESANARLHEVAAACATAEQERDLLNAGNSRLQGEIHAGSDLIATYRRVNRELRSDRDQLKAENEALRKEREGKVLVPVLPSPGLLMSMALRNDHALGCPGYYDQTIFGRKRGYEGVSHARMLECALNEMRQLHEEVVGTGFYSPEKEDGYVAMSKEAGHD